MQTWRNGCDAKISTQEDASVHDHLCAQRGNSTDAARYAMMGCGAAPMRMVLRIAHSAVPMGVTATSQGTTP